MAEIMMNFLFFVGIIAIVMVALYMINKYIFR